MKDKIYFLMTLGTVFPLCRLDPTRPPVPSRGAAQILVSPDGGALAAIFRPPVSKL